MNKKAVRAIIIKDDKILVMFRNKHGHKFYTLVGGQVDEGESLQQTLVREVKEETGLTITSASEVFYENHKSPFNIQHIYICSVTSDSELKIQNHAEESIMNHMGMNTHTPMWVNFESFETLPFRTPQLHLAIINGITNGFPESPVQIN